MLSVKKKLIHLTTGQHLYVTSEGRVALTSDAENPTTKWQQSYGQDGKYQMICAVEVDGKKYMELQGDEVGMTSDGSSDQAGWLQVEESDGKIMIRNFVKKVFLTGSADGTVKVTDGSDAANSLWTFKK